MHTKQLTQFSDVQPVWRPKLSICQKREKGKSFSTTTLRMPKGNAALFLSEEGLLFTLFGDKKPEHVLFPLWFADV